MASTAYDKIRVNGLLYDKITYQAFAKANAKLIKDTGASMTPVQGSYNKGGVSASAGTHDGGGMIDIRTWNLTTSQRVHAVKCLRYYGFAAWYRYPPLFDEHIHCAQVGNEKLSPAAARQITQYRNHQNGLANFGYDNTWRPKKIVAYKYVEPKKPKPSPGRTVNRKIDQVWHVKPRQTARFRSGPREDAEILTVKTSGNFRFAEYAMDSKGRKWLRLADSTKWVNSNVMSKGRA